MFVGRKQGKRGGWATRGVSVVIAVFVLAMMTASPAAAQEVRVTILHISDTHSHLAAWGPKDANLDGTLGGLPKAAAIVAAERASDPHALLVHAGDVVEGDFFYMEDLGVSELQLLQAIGLDAMALGNHEFRFGPDVLVETLQAAWPVTRVPIVCTNLDPLGHALGSWIVPTFVKDVDGVKVGFFGLTNKGAPADQGTIKILKVTNALVQAAVDALRAAGAQIVVGLSHQGMDVARGLAAGVSGIDVIVNGHDNAVLEQPEQVARLGGGATLIVSAGQLYRYVGRLRLSVTGGVVSLVDYALLGADAEAPSSPEILSAVQTLKEAIVARYGDVYHTPLAWAERGITADWPAHGAKRDTALGNLITDAYRAWTGTDIALDPLAYMGDPLPAGTIVGADLFRAMSYGNLATDPADGKVVPWKLVTFRMSGAVLKGLLQMLIGLGGPYFPQVSGLRFDYDSRTGEILSDTMRVKGHTLAPDRSYSVTVTEQIYAILAWVFGFPMEDVQPVSVSAFDALRDLVTERRRLGLATSNRIRDVAAIPRNETAGNVQAISNAGQR